MNIYTIKPLVWNEWSEGFRSDPLYGWEFTINTETGSYNAHAYMREVNNPFSNQKTGYFNDLQSAKEFCQGIYEESFKQILAEVKLRILAEVY